MAIIVDIDEFIRLKKEHPVIDVRSPDEFVHGHIPGAYSVPLMDNVERAIVGTIYRQNGKQPAILKGFDFAGPRLREYIRQTKRITKGDTVLLHCWRGGMRSGFMAFLMEFYGFKVYLLKGGYKSYRNWVLKQFAVERSMIVLGGMTGSGKTLVLQELAKRGEAVIDLEKLAAHKGSAFGSIGEPAAPSQEMFENRLAEKLSYIPTDDLLWLEDESRTIGTKVIPEKLWLFMRNKNLLVLQIPFAERLQYIVSSYGKYDLDELIIATNKIARRLGNEQWNEAIAALKANDLTKGFEPSLKYYDKAYAHKVSKRENKIFYLPIEKIEPGKIAELLIRQKVQWK